MTLQELETNLLNLDPYDIVSCGMDSFNAYTYIDDDKLPKDMVVSISALSDDDLDKWESFCSVYLDQLAAR